MTAQEIKEIRKKSGLTQKAFAAEIGITQSHLSKVEHNAENISKSVLMLIEIKFGSVGTNDGTDN